MITPQHSFTLFHLHVYRVQTQKRKVGFGVWGGEWGLMANNGYIMRDEWEEFAKTDRRFFLEPPPF